MFKSRTSRLISTFLLISLLMSTFLFAGAAETATPTASTVIVDGQEIVFDAYKINGNNYFKLRDLAYVVSYTEKQFEVIWEESLNAIVLLQGETYSEVGGELSAPGTSSKSATLTSSSIYLGNYEIYPTGYKIGGNNYFKLRDIGELFDFAVEWEADLNTIVINTSRGYTPEEQTTTPPTQSTDGENLSYEQEVIDLVNAYRAQYGLSPLVVSSVFEEATDIRANELQYSYAHTRPDGSDFRTVFDELGYDGSYTGENIAYGQKTPEEVMDAWMNSQGHRDNILRSDYYYFGVGHVNIDGVDYWVQIFELDLGHSQPEPEPEPEPEPDYSNVEGENIQFEVEVFDLVNEIRYQYGLTQFEMVYEIDYVADIRVREQPELFSHTRPDGSEWHTVVTENNISYKTIGENLAYGQVTPELVVEGWMNSDGHRANILNPDFTVLGVGHYNYNGTNYWAQIFWG